MASVRELLNQVWTEFRKVGVADDLTIVENVGAYLLEIEEIEQFARFNDNLKPRKSEGLELAVKVVKSLLGLATNEAGGAAKLFDKYVLFFLPVMMAGGRYPTPRHITKFMIYLSQVEPNHQLADFACGSGGFLVNCTNSRDALTMGIDISAEWARLTYTNLLLHKLPSNIIRVASANALNISEREPNATYDRILTNPSFGEKIDANLASEVLKQRVGSRSETVLTLLALQHLSKNGLATILLPSGPLFSRSATELYLRQRLLDRYTLEAVVTLPRDALQPYSPVQTHILVARNKVPNDNHRIWFFQVEQDGYSTGRSRDLTASPQEPNDLQLIESVWSGDSESSIDLPESSEKPLVRVETFSFGDSFHGIVIQANEGSLLSAIDLFPSTSDLGAFILVEVTNSEIRDPFHFQIFLNTGRHETTEHNREYFWREIYQWNSRKAPPKTLLISGKYPEQAVVVSSLGRLLGFTVPKSAVKEPSYDLRFKQYLTTQQEVQQASSAVVQLGEIRNSQQQLAETINSLLNRLEGYSINQEIHFPPPLPIDRFTRVNLNQAQLDVWEKIVKKVEVVEVEVAENKKKRYETAVHFTPLDLEPEEANDVSDITRTTLTLLENLGLIVSVTIPGSGPQDSFHLYRLITERDLCSASMLKGEEQ